MDQHYGLKDLSSLSQIKWRRLLPLALPALVALLLLATLLTSVYTVQPEGKAVVRRFGKVVAVKEPGLHFRLPFGIDQQIFVPTERVLKEEFGFRSREAGQRTRYDAAGYDDESLMLTGDLNVISVDWVVQYQIRDPDMFLHRVRDQRKTIRDVSEAVMRRLVGNRIGSDVLTVGRVGIAQQAREEMQEILDRYDIGISIRTVELQDVTPPDPVKPAFNEVNEARQELERLINEAEKQRNQEIPRARGEARRLVSEAEGYAAERLNRAHGETARFTAMLEQYRRVPEITRRRLFLEMLDAVLPQAKRIYVMPAEGQSPLPLLHLDDYDRIGGEKP